MKKIILLIAVLIAACLTNSQAQDTWIQKANFGGVTRLGATGFSIGSKGYIGTGYRDGAFLKDFWEYDPAVNTWTQKADFVGIARDLAASFSIDNKGYIGTGFNSVNYPFTYLRDFYEYDPVANTWTQKADFAGVERSGAASFSINGKGYIGTGEREIDHSNLRDFWAYDPVANTWTQKADFVGVERSSAASFSIDGKGYIGTGYTGYNCSNGGTAMKDFYEYDPAMNSWTQKANFEGTARYLATGLSIGIKGYIGSGSDCNANEMKDFWEYDPAVNAWTRKADFGGAARYFAVGFTIGCKGYIGTGGSFTYPYTYVQYNDFWEWEGGNCSSELTISNVIPDNAGLTDTVVLWEGTIDDDPMPLKVCADGSHATNFKFTNYNGSINSGYIGFRIKSDPNSYDAEQIGDFIVTNNDNVVSAVYYHPTYVGENYKPKRTDTIEIYTPTDGVLFSIPLEIYRAPIVFIHGLLGDAGLFAPMEDTLKSDSLYVEQLTTKLNYTSASWKGFEENTSVVPAGINSLLTTCREFGFSAGKVDLIGHSLGGIMSRLYLQGNYGVTYRNDVNEIITINTPHSGSQLANVVVRSNNGVACTIIKYIFSESEAACPTLFVDLSVDGFAIDDELNGPLLNANVVPSASIATKNNDPIVPSDCSALSELFSAGVLAYNILDWIGGVFNSEANDLAVAVSSQKGGLSGSKTILIQNQCHVGSPANAEVIARCELLLSKNPSSSYFSQNGFHPVDLNFSSSPFKIGGNGGSEPLLTGDVTITKPSNSSSFHPGDNVTIKVTGSSNVVELALAVGNSSLPLFVENSFTNSATFHYTVPQDAYGEIKVIVLGIDADTNLIDIDTLKINASTSATLDSLSIVPKELSVPQYGTEYFQLNGYFSDGITRDLSGESDVQYSVIDTTIANHLPTNIIKGLLIGSTQLSISYLGKSLLVPIEVYDGSDFTSFATGTITGSPFCAGSQVSVPYTSVGIVFNESNIFTAQLSNASGNFTAPVTIGTLTGSDKSGTIAAIIPQYTPEGSGYRIRIISNNPVIISSANTVNLTVHPLEGIIISGNTAICVGSSTTLTASSAGNPIYIWQPGNLSGVTQTLYPSTTTTYTVTSTTQLNCSSTATVTVTVNFTPPATITPSGTVLICTGSSTTLTANTGSGLSYQWIKDGSNISGATASSYTTSVVGSYTVKVTNISGCSKTSSASAVTINSLPPATITPNGTVSICSGDQTTLTANAGTGLTWQWLKDGIVISGATAKTYKAEVQGQYKVVVTNSSGCSKTSSATTVNVNALPAAIITPSATVSISTGTSTTLSANTGTGLTYKWLKDGIYISNATASTYTTSMDAKYTVEVTNASGCKLVSAATTVKVVAIPAAPIWAYSEGGSSNYAEAATSLAVDASGNVYTTGFFSNNFGAGDFDPGPGVYSLYAIGDADIFVQKVDSARNLVWVKRMGSTGFNKGESITVDDAGNVFTTGHFYGTADFDPGTGVFNLTSAGSFDIFIQKLDASGNFVWAKRIGSDSTEMANSIRVDASGNVYTTGYFYETVDFDPNGSTFNLTSEGSKDIFILKLDASGNFVWAKRMGSTGLDDSHSIALDASGNIYTQGGFTGTVDFDPGPGTFNLTGGGMFIQKLNPLGNLIWTKNVSASDYSTGDRSLTIDDLGNSIIVGHFSGTVDFDPGTDIFNLAGGGLFILKLDVSGNFVWAKGIVMSIPSMGYWDYNSAYYEGEGFAITTDNLGSVYITGGLDDYNSVDFDPGLGTYKLTGSTNTNEDIVVEKLDALGNFVWVHLIISDLSYTRSAGNSIAIDKVGHIYMGGFSEGYSIDFDPGAGSDNIQGQGITVWKWSQCPELKVSITPAAPECLLPGSILNADAVNAISYQWLLNTVPIEGATNATYVPSIAGEYRVEVANLSGCTSLSGSVFVYSSLATITPSDTLIICKGYSMYLNANYGWTYQWFKDGNLISGATSQGYESYDANRAGEYTVQVTQKNGCISISDPIKVIENPSPSATLTPQGNIAICSDESITFTANTGAGLSYQWWDYYGAIPGATSKTYSSNVAGLYYVQTTNIFNCSKYSQSATVTVNPSPTSTITPNTTVTICSGETTTLTANSGSGLTYQWMKDANNISGATKKTYKATEQGDYKVKVTNATGCIKTSSATTVNVIALPAATISPSGSISICTGATTTLTANTGTGLTYKWFKDDVAISGATNNTYTASADAKYTVQVTNSSGCMFESEKTTVSVVAIPTATVDPAGTINICQGNTQTLTANSSGSGLTYKWLKDGTAISGATAKTYKVTETGGYKVKITNATGCTKTSTSTTVNVNALPIATISPSGTVSICNGATTTLTANAGSGLTYKWFKDGGAVSGAANKTYSTNTTESGKYTVTVTNSSVCSLTSAATTVKRLADPNAEITILDGGNLDICLGEVKLKGPGPAGTGWLWFKGSSSIAGATDQNYLPTTAGTYKVEVTNTSGCSKKSDNGVVVVKTCKESISGNSETGITATIYPNPTAGTFQVSISNLTQENIIVTVLNLLGQTIYNRQYSTDAFQSSQTISLSDAADGIYLVKILMGEKIVMKQIVVQR